MKNTVLITGASGLLGRSVYQNIKSIPEYNVIGLAFTRAIDGLTMLDLTDFKAVQELIEATKPKIIIHCAAEKKPDVCATNPELAIKLNIQSSGNLAKVAKDSGAIFIYISTDYVFDGTKAPYQVHDVPNPLNFYGKSKLEGEVLVLREYPDAIVLRVPVLYGITKNRNESAVNILIDLVQNDSIVHVDHYHVRYPTLVDDVAKCIISLLDKYESGLIHGIFHFSANQAMTKYEMCKSIGNAISKSTSHLIPDSEPPKEPTATRPFNSKLSNDRLLSCGIDFKCVDFEEWFKTHINDI